MDQCTSTAKVKMSPVLLSCSRYEEHQSLITIHVLISHQTLWNSPSVEIIKLSRCIMAQLN